jgi:DNA-binding winged helix-turn-helix (wHTH) protein
MGSLRYLFEDYSLDTDRRELYRGANVVSIAPQVFDLLDYLIRNRERVVSKDDLIDAIWNGRRRDPVAGACRLLTQSGHAPSRRACGTALAAAGPSRPDTLLPVDLKL